jgi:CRISPR-associated protein Cmr3
MAEFSVLDHLDKLTPDKGSAPAGSQSFHCPVCDTKNFKVELKSGKYGTFSCDCANTEDGKRRIRNALSPAQNPNPKPLRPKGHRGWSYYDAAENYLFTVHRWDDPDGDPKWFQNGRCIRQSFSPSIADDLSQQQWKNASGETPKAFRHLALPYGLKDALQALSDGAPYVFWVEGEPCVDALRKLGLYAVTSLGGAGKFDPERDGGLIPADRLVVAPDRDQCGLKHAEAVAAAYPGCQWLYAFPGTPQWNGSCPAQYGLDIADWIDDGATVEQILAAVGPKAAKQSASVAAPAGDANELNESVRLIARADALRLDPHQLIGSRLAEQLELRAAALNVPCAALLNGLLPVAASLAQIGTEILVSEASGFRQPPILWNLTAAPTGSLKSDTTDLPVQPLYPMQSVQDALPENAGCSHFTSALTLPGLSRLQAEQPMRGCLIYIDELSGFVKKLHNDQKSGRGDEQSRLLTLYDGRPQRGTFADKARNFSVARSSFSFLSTIQPSVLAECMGDLDDATGLWARFNLYELPRQRRVLPRERKVDRLMPELAMVYQRIRDLQPASYELSADAYDLFSEFYSQQEDRRLDPTVKPALAAYYAKQEGRCARIALVLNLLQGAAVIRPDGTFRGPAKTISAETMQGAITVSRFYEAQALKFYAIAMAETASGLDGDALLILEFIRKAHGRPVTVRDISKGPRALRGMSTEQIRKALGLLIDRCLVDETGSSYQLVTL